MNTTKEETGGRRMKKIVAWKLIAYDEDNNEINLMNIPNALAQEIDSWLTELEDEE